MVRDFLLSFKGPKDTLVYLAIRHMYPLLRTCFLDRRSFWNFTSVPPTNKSRKVEIFKLNEMQKIQKILKVKSSFQFDVQGRGNLGAKTKMLGSQNLHGCKEPKFTMAEINIF